MSSKKRKSSAVTEESSATMAAIKDEFALEIRDAPPAHLLINTRSFYKSQKHETKEYVAGDYQWRLIIYPEGRDFNKGGDYISVYLSLSNTDALPEGWEFNADCCILVKNQISNNYFCFRVKKRRFNALNSEWGLSISKKMLPFHGFFVHDKCVFGAEVYPHETHPVACLSLFDWKISNFSKLEGDLMTSEAFLVGGLRWKIRLYPKGHNEERDTSVSIYMACDDSKSFAPHEKAEANFCFRIKNQLSHAHLYRSWSHVFTSSSRPSGFINFIPIAEMCDPNKGFLIDDCCFLERNYMRGNPSASVELRPSTMLLLANDDAFSIETREVSPANLLLKIESFSLLSEYGIQKYESREFVAGECKWRLTIYLDGYGSSEGEKGEHVSVFLSAAGTSSLPVDWEVHAIFSFFLYNQIADNYLCFRGKARRFHAVNPKWGFTKLISKKSFTDPSNGYLVDDKCVFGAEVFVIKSQRVIESLCLMRSSSQPLKREWEIAGFSKLVSVWDSEVFEAGDYRWKLKLYPKGCGSGVGRGVSIFAYCVDSGTFTDHEKLKAKITFTVKKRIHDHKHHSETFSYWFTCEEDYEGYDEFIGLGEMRESRNGFVIDDAFLLEVDISVQAFVGGGDHTNTSIYCKNSLFQKPISSSNFVPMQGADATLEPQTFLLKLSLHLYRIKALDWIFSHPTCIEMGRFYL